MTPIVAGSRIRLPETRAGPAGRARVMTYEKMMSGDARFRAVITTGA